jgi:hypothetical protein
MKIRRNQSLTVVAEFSEIYRHNDYILVGFQTPTENPIIHVTKPDDLEVEVSGGISDGKIEDTVIPGQYEYKGVHFPPAQMSISWRPKT